MPKIKVLPLPPVAEPLRFELSLTLPEAVMIQKLIGPTSIDIAKAKYDMTQAEADALYPVFSALDDTIRGL